MGLLDIRPDDLLPILAFILVLFLIVVSLSYFSIRFPRTFSAPTNDDTAVHPCSKQ